MPGVIPLAAAGRHRRRRLARRATALARRLGAPWPSPRSRSCSRSPQLAGRPTGRGRRSARAAAGRRADRVHAARHRRGRAVATLGQPRLPGRRARRRAADADGAPGYGVLVPAVPGRDGARGAGRQPRACCGSPSRPPRSSPRSWSATAAPAPRVEAAWKYVVICSVGIAIAFLGTVLLYYAAQHGRAHRRTALDWTAPDRARRPAWTRA